MFPGAAATGFHARAGLMRAIGGSAQPAIATDGPPPAREHRGANRSNAFPRRGSGMDHETSPTPPTAIPPGSHLGKTTASCPPWESGNRTTRLQGGPTKKS